MEYEILETQDYIIFEKLFKESGLEFNLEKNSLHPWGFIKAFCCKDVDGNIIAGSSITYRKGKYILNDIAVLEEFSSVGYDLQHQHLQPLALRRLKILLREPDPYDLLPGTYPRSMKDLELEIRHLCSLRQR